jgi:hypothetical protein
LEGLLGVMLLRNLAERLKSFEVTKRSGIANVDDQNIERMLEALTADEAKLEALKADAEQSRQRVNELKPNGAHSSSASPQLVVAVATSRQSRTWSKNGSNCVAASVKCRKPWSESLPTSCLST